MSSEPNTSDDNYVIDIEELVLPFKTTSSGLSSPGQLTDTTSDIKLSYDSTG